MIGNVDHWARDTILGWAADEAHPDEIVSVELWINGNIACLVPARLYREDLKQAGLGHGMHGFSVDPQPYLRDASNYLELRIAGTDFLLGARNLVDMAGHDLLEISQLRWKGDEPPEGLTWGRPMTGDSFVDIVEGYWPSHNNSRIVEVGPGYGRLLSTLLDRELPFRTYLGIELSAARVGRLRQLFSDERVRFDTGDINTHRFPEEADIVISSATFIHLYPDCSRALDNIRRQISANSLLAIDFIDPTHYPGRGFDDCTGTYIISYSRDDLRRLFENCGYRVIAMPDYVIGIGTIGEVFGIIVVARPNSPVPVGTIINDDEALR